MRATRKASRRVASTPVAPADAFTNASTQGGLFKGETVNTYEVGARMPFLDNKLQATAAIFYNDYKNLQTAAHANQAHAAIIEAIINAGSARTYGVEGTLNYRILTPVTVGLAAGYLNAKYKTFDNTDGSVLVPFDLSGTRMPNAPELQASVNANYDQPISASLRFRGQRGRQLHQRHPMGELRISRRSTRRDAIGVCDHKPARRGPHHQ